ncbi:MAG: Fe(2+)-trafficking protein [Phycisphaeraceae bacterium]|nr:Fe(2+)-trafficking protein [Phycisphaeraceae bacterium]MCW5754043.1 Fe(2+)-trafficking protein [Phycisphaeraceae bacterium]
MDIAQRIAQFENMCREDPTNDMAHFSLGGALNQAGEYARSAAAFLKAVELNPAFTKAYQMAGAALMAAGDVESAADVLDRGYREAAARGDRMPQKAMGELLTKLGKPLPEVAAAAAEAGHSEGGFVCSVTGRAGSQMARPPFRGPIGVWIREHVSAETFDAWIRQGTKVINELRLDLSRDQDSIVYDQHMREYLGIDDALYERLTGEKPPKSLH